MKSRPNAWITILNPQPDPRCRLFCLPYAGGGASMFRTWPSQLPAGVELWLIQLPGREERFREPRFTRVAPLVDALAPLVAAHLDKPFAVFGYSMGGLIGFELIRALRRLGAPAPQRLFVTARQAPHLVETRPSLYQMPDDQLFEELDRRYGGIPSEALKNPEIRSVFVPLLRADIEMIETYQCQPDAPLDCPISVFGGQTDRITHDELAAWQEHTRHPVSVRLFEGGHFFIQTNQAPLLSAIGHELPA
ncbi:MAG TPA: alpha/beta fold hydrolase [Vicinamibacterales bacterium]|nr:alpha/beta fold hydrolase [Vicinamibacterales bacterium]